MRVVPTFSSTPSFNPRNLGAGRDDPGDEGREGDLGVGAEVDRLEARATVERGVDGTRPFDDERALGVPRPRIPQELAQPLDRRVARAERRRRVVRQLRAPRAPW